jgi:threonine dehydrogenase-like Zn-dependent dehydrogenase
MKALAVRPSTPGAHMVQRPEPHVGADHDVKLRVIRVGICGTDREEVAGGRAKASPDQQELVIGHEMIGQVVETGSRVSRVKKGDHAVFTVRRGCGKCLPCLMNRPDMCRTGEYNERGIWGRDGYQTEYVVDAEQYVVHVPDELESLGVLIEPLSISEKAIDEAVRIQQARLPDFQSTPDWLFGKRCLVAGLGPVGLLAAMVLKLRGAVVFGLDIVDADSARPQWLRTIGGQYVDGRMPSSGAAADPQTNMDVILEATGIPSVEFRLLDALADNGIYLLTGIPGGDRPVEIQGAEILRKLVLNNQVMVGSVNAARDHYQMAVDDLLSARRAWGGHMDKLITRRFAADDFAAAFAHHEADEIKTVIEWSR